MLERKLRDTRKQNTYFQNLNDELFIENRKLRSGLSKSDQNVANVNETAHEYKRAVDSIAAIIDGIPSRNTHAADMLDPLNRLLDEVSAETESETEDATQ